MSTSASTSASGGASASAASGGASGAASASAASAAASGAAASGSAPARGPDPRATRSRAAALAAAEELLVEQGWSAVTHVAVAARSGVGRTTLYRHWPDAAGLIRDVIAERIAGAHTAPTGDLRADLERELDGMRALLHEPVSETGLRAVIERAGSDPVFAELKEALYRGGSQVFREVVEGAKARGELPAELETDQAIDELAGPLVYRRLLAGRTFDGEYVRRIVAAFLAAHAVG
ncbi:TetR/AcrR family transcriptional regulator [Actinacidiphila epipremni]|uniref:TetR/AcrR family transcriptional regulator n=1 Tax=Actinacidiphila epipremni TaxID=2053013 RepID=A0ABX0ZWY0_9ACTN|nr:TetR/AcrR family transcriptional regulator [Actinacidiphila epipremni]NJP46078.1 TetR/AcrR family transcriptional regulator [Actinacidiphila epipremni]